MHNEKFIITAAARLTSMELLAVRDGVYYVPDILLRMFLQRLMNLQKEFFPEVDYNKNRIRWQTVI